MIPVNQFPKITEKEFKAFLDKTAAANPKVSASVIDLLPIRQKIRDVEKKTGCHIGHVQIFGERSNGKTFNSLAWALYDCTRTGDCITYIRASKEGFKGKNGRGLWNDIVNAGIVSYLTGGYYCGITYYGGGWYFLKMEDDKNGNPVTLREPEAFCWPISLSTWETDKGFTIPNAYIHIFDEFIRRRMCDDQEFEDFEQVKSTLARQGDKDRFYMLGNTFTPYNPYFRNMRLSKIAKEMKPGDLKVVINKSDDPDVPDAGILMYYSDEGMKKSKRSNVFFNYGAGTDNMITRGTWDRADYPHIIGDAKYSPKEVDFTFFIIWDHETLKCDMVVRENTSFIAITRKTTEIKHPDTDIVYADVYDTRPNWRRNMLKDYNKVGLETRILKYFQRDMVRYQDNEVGDMVLAFINWCIKING